MGLDLCHSIDTKSTVDSTLLFVVVPPDPQAIERAMAEAMKDGCRLITCHHFTSALAYEGAANVAEPFFRAAETCGFSRSAASGCDALQQWASEREELATTFKAAL